MLITDQVLFICLLLIDTLFTILTFLPHGSDFEEQLSETGFNIGMIPLILRITFFPLVSAIGWGILSIYSLTLNNCSQVFDACYTSPLFDTIGGAIPNPLGTPLSILFMLLSIMMIVMSAAIIFTVSGAIMTATRNKKHG